MNTIQEYEPVETKNKKVIWVKKRTIEVLGRHELTRIAFEKWERKKNSN